MGLERHDVEADVDEGGPRAGLLMIRIHLLMDTHHTRVDGTSNFEVGVSRMPGHPGYQSDA
jgi:hypothetical protein